MAFRGRGTYVFKISSVCGFSEGTNLVAYHASGPTLWQRPAGVQMKKGVGAPRQDWSEGMFSYGKSSVLRFCKGSTFVKTRGMLLVGKPCS